MDFAWVVDALRRGLKVTREAWKQDPPVKYIYMITGENGKRAILMSVLSGSGSDFEWYPNAEHMLTATDWEEYVEPKKAALDKLTQEDLPVWPEVDADGYARISKDSGVVIHDGVYRCKKEPAKAEGNRIDYARGVVHCGEDTGYMAEQLEMLADIYAEKISQRVAQLLQKTDVPPDKNVGQIMREYKTRLDSLGRPDENCANCEKHGWFEGKFVWLW